MSTSEPVAARPRRRWRKDRTALLALFGAPLAILLTVFLYNYAQLMRYQLTFWTVESVAGKLWYGTMTLYDGMLISANSLRVLFDREAVSQDSPLPSLHLRVEPGSLEQMVSDLPYSAKAREYPAWLLYPDGQWQRIDYRLRGGNIWHWLPDKPSLRLKLKKSAPIELQRRINLVNPEDRPMISNLMGERLARDLGVLTHETRFVRLFINEVYRGVYHQSTHEDENLLGLRGRLPGPIFKGENLEPRWRPEQFEIGGETEILEKFNPMERLVEAIYAPLDVARFETLWGILSFEKYARWVAAMNLAGSTHTNFRHNQLYYFDPGAGLLEPMISDINGHGMADYPRRFNRLNQRFEPRNMADMNARNHPLLDAALRDPRFYHRRNEVLYQALRGSASPTAQRTILEATFQAIDGDVRADHRKAALQDTFVGWYRIPYSNSQYETSKQQLYGWIERRHDFLMAALADSRVRVTVDPGDRGGRVLFAVEVDGHPSIQFDPATLDGRVFADRGLSGEPRGPARARELLSPGLIDNPAAPGQTLRPAPQTYLFSVETEDSRGVARALLGAFHNAVTGAPVTPEVVDAAVDPRAIGYNEVSLHPWRIPAPPSGEVVLGPGEVILERDLEIGPAQRLTVLPGTHLLLGPEVSIAAKGVVRLVGTADQPITVERLDPKRAWGALVIQGPASAGSRIADVRIEGGSLTERFNIRYSGMVSVAWSDDFHLSRTRIADNRLSDDALHIVNGNFVLEDLEMAGCYEDCIDLDYATGTIDRLTVTGAGNDGLDLMSSEVALGDVSISLAADKGISVGEKSNITARQLAIERSAIGLAAKDRSRIRLTDARFTDNDVAIDAYVKHPMYGGPGLVELRRVAFADNQVNLRTEEGAQVLVIDQAIPDRISGDGQVSAQPAGS